MASKQVTEVAEKLAKTSEPKGSQLAKAILVAMKEVGTIPENGFNQRMGYKFARHQDIAEACRNAFLKAGLVMIPVGVEPTYTTVSTKGGDHRCVTLRVSYRLLHTSGEETYLQVVGCGADQSDKAEYKAMTGALKWALTQLLVLNRGGEDSEVDADEPSFPSQQRTVQPAQPEEQPEAAEARMELRNKILGYCNGDPAKATQILRELSGNRFSTMREVEKAEIGRIMALFDAHPVYGQGQ